MSGKRLKVKGCQSRHLHFKTQARGNPIPIPSFATPVHSSLKSCQVTPMSCKNYAENLNRPKNASTSKVLTSPSTQLVPVSLYWSIDDLILLEKALQLNFYRSQYKCAMDFDEFFALVPKIPFQGGAVTDASQTDVMDAEDIAVTTALNNRPADAAKPISTNDLSEHERLLYDLLCVASPTLYHICQQNYQDKFFSTTSSSKLSQEGTWSLQMTSKADCADSLKSPSNRTLDFRALLHSKSQILLSESQFILNAIQDHRQSQSRRSDSRKKIDTRSFSMNKSAPEPLQLLGSQTNLTLEERVRARAHANEKQRIILENESALYRSVGGVGLGVDTSWLVRIADALWQHSRDVIARQKRFRPPHAHVSFSSLTESLTQRKPTTAVCALMLQDAVLYLSRTSSVAAHATTMKLSNGANKQEKNKPVSIKRVIFDAIQELCRLLPCWITISDQFSKDKCDNTCISKNATLWIQADNFQKARKKLSNTTDDMTPTRESTQHSKEHCDSNIRKQNARDVTPNSSDKPKLKRSRDQIDTTTPQCGLSEHRSYDNIVVTADTRTCTAISHCHENSQSLETRAMKKRALSLECFASPNALQQPMSPKNIKSNSPIYQHKLKNEIKPLRVNPELTFSGADYNGGEILQPSFHFKSNPRGLRMLFLRLNKGERI